MMATTSSPAQNQSSNGTVRLGQSFFLPFANLGPRNRGSDEHDEDEKESRRRFHEQVKIRNANSSATLPSSRRMMEQKKMRNTPTIMKTRGKRYRIQKDTSIEYKAYNALEASSADGDLSMSACTSSNSQNVKMEIAPGKFTTAKPEFTPGFLKKHLPDPNVQKDATKGLSPIERLPYDLLNDIFFRSRNIYFPRSSPVIGMKLSSPTTYNRFCREYLCFRTLGKTQAPDHLSKTEHVYQVTKNDAVPLPEDEAATNGTLSDDLGPSEVLLHSMGPAICWHVNQSIEEITVMIDVALTCRWMSKEYIQSVRAQLNHPDRAPLGRKLLCKPTLTCNEPEFSGTVWHSNPDHMTKLDLCLSKQIVPRNLLTLPIKPGQMDLLKLLFHLGASVNSCNSCDGELALDLLRNCAIQRDFKSMEMLLKPGTNIYPDIAFRRWALQITHCDRTMLGFLKHLRLIHGGKGTDEWPKNWPRKSYDWSVQWPENDPVVCAMLHERYGSDYLLDLEAEMRGEYNGEKFQSLGDVSTGMKGDGSNGAEKKASKKRVIEEMSYDFTDDEFDSDDVLSDADDDAFEE